MRKQAGISILGVIVFGFLLILVLSYFHVSIKAVVESPTGQENVNYVKGTGQDFWNKYLAEPAHYLWQDVWVNIFWKGFIFNMQRITNGQPTDYNDAANNLKVQTH